MTLFWRFQKHTVSHLSFLFPSSVFLHYINICGQNLQNPVLISISTVHFNQVESRRYVTPGAGSWLRTVNVSITCRVWHHDASNSSNGLPVISGSHATHWNNEKAEPRPQGFSLKNGRGGKRLFFLRKSPGDEPWQGPSATSPFFLFFNVSSFFDSLLSLYNKVSMEQTYQWLKRLSSHKFVSSSCKSYSNYSVHFLPLQKEKKNIPYKGNVLQCSCTVCNEQCACFWGEGLISHYNTISTISL